MDSTSPPFQVGQFYSRKDINSVMGVRHFYEAESYLPTVGHKVVCGCFDPEINPELPFKVIVGHAEGIVRRAVTFQNQRYYIPVFIKRAAKKYEYVGDYMVERHSRDPKTIMREIERWDLEDVERVLYLTKR